MLTMSFAGPAGSLGNYLQGLEGSQTEVKALQVALNTAGFNAGTADGSVGPNTNAAIIDWVIHAASTAAQFSALISQIPDKVRTALNALLTTDKWLRDNTKNIPLVGSIGLSTVVRQKDKYIGLLQAAQAVPYVPSAIKSAAKDAITYIKTITDTMNDFVYTYAGQITQAVSLYNSLTGGGGGGGGGLPSGSLPGGGSLPTGTGTLPVAVTGLIKAGGMVVRDMRTTVAVPGGAYVPAAPPQPTAPPVSKYPAGSIARFNTTRGAWTIYVPKGGGLFGYGVYPNLMGLGWSAQFPVSPAPPAGTEQAGQEPTKEDAIAAGATPINQPEQDRPFYKSPWVIGGAIAVVVAGAGGYVLLRRKRPTTTSV